VRTSARSTARGARTTGRQAAETASRSAEAAGTELGAAAISAQRVLLTTVGAIATAGESIKRTALTYTDPGRLSRQLDRFERRGARLLDRGRRQLRRRTR
jgi:hypothetical protein